jgi:hypothetical protein
VPSLLPLAVPAGLQQHLNSSSSSGLTGQQLLLLLKEAAARSAAAAAAAKSTAAAAAAQDAPDGEQQQQQQQQQQGFVLGSSSSSSSSGGKCLMRLPCPQLLLGYQVSSLSKTCLVTMYGAYRNHRVAGIVPGRCTPGGVNDAFSSC